MRPPGWGTIVERTGMTKGALYHHFDAKEPLASAIIEEGSETLLVAFRSVVWVGFPRVREHDPRHVRGRQHPEHGQNGQWG